LLGKLCLSLERLGLFTVVDISDPVNPFLVGTLPITQSYPMAFDGDIAYVTGADFLVLDIEANGLPAILGTVDTSGNAFGVSAEGDFAYVADGSSGLQIVNVSIPDDSYIVGDVDTPESAKSVDVAGGHAYIADGPGDLQVDSLADPALPTIVGSVDPTSPVILGSQVYTPPSPPVPFYYP
jgi:hypothetical protein